MVTDRERDYMYRIFAADPRMRVNVGIRRRLAPLDGEQPPEDRAHEQFLLMTMPGAPILYYGDEIGMGDNIYLGDRNGVRTPMQWSPTATPASRAPIRSACTCRRSWIAMYGYESVNVEAQHARSCVAAQLDAPA